MNAYDAVIFDMDGTILNSTAGLCHAMNYAMGKCGHEHDFTPSQINRLFGSGVEVAVMRALAVEAHVPMDDLVVIGTPDQPKDLPVDMDEVHRVKAVYDPYYAEHCTDEAAPYDGIVEAIHLLHDAGVRCAVVSNKADVAVQRIVASVLPSLFDTQMGVTPDRARKPAPDMVRATMQRLGVDGSRAVYVGDTEIDFQTARNSGLDCISVDWGFRTHEFLERNGSSMIAHTPRDIYAFVCEGRHE